MKHCSHISFALNTSTTLAKVANTAEPVSIELKSGQRVVAVAEEDFIRMQDSLGMVMRDPTDPELKLYVSALVARGVISLKK